MPNHMQSSANMVENGTAPDECSPQIKQFRRNPILNTTLGNNTAVYSGRRKHINNRPLRIPKCLLTIDIKSDLEKKEDLAHTVCTHYEHAGVAVGRYGKSVLTIVAAFFQLFPLSVLNSLAA